MVVLLQESLGWKKVNREVVESSFIKDIPFMVWHKSRSSANITKKKKDSFLPKLCKHCHTVNMKGVAPFIFTVETLKRKSLSKDV